MKKLPVVAVCGVAVLGLIWTGTAWWTGFEVEKQVRAALAEPVSGSTFHDLTLLDYQRGILSSSARYRVSLVPGVLPEAAGAVDTSFEFDATVHHGPWPLRRLLRGDWSPVLALATAVPLPGGAWQPWFDAAGGVQPLVVEVDANYSGDVRFQARLAPIELAREGAQLSVSGGVIEGQVTPDFGLLQLQGRVAEAKLITQSVPAATLATAEGEGQDAPATEAGHEPPPAPRAPPAPADAAEPPTEVVFRDVRWQSRNERGAFGLYPGQIEIQVRRLDIATTDEIGAPLPLSLHDYRMVGELEEQGEMLSGRVEYDVGRLEAAGIDLGRLDAALRFDRLNAPIVQQIVGNYRDLTSGAAPGTPVLPDAEALDAWWRDSLEALLPDHPVFALDPLRWELPQGKSWIQVEVALQPASGPIFGFDHVASLDARLVLSRPMAVEVLARLSQLPGGSGLDLEQARAAASLNVSFLQRLALASGYVSADKDALLTRLSYADGRFTLNDKPLDLGGNWTRWLPRP